ncbi:XdhC family protein [Govanella unica]|uniref:NTP transferase domain-containing protein n=1 Tax=Govanella unica TaxID=2975056 RepID=A0A9X3TYJ5_9PROT|nr:XdhC family protein [Govania unica]MDA5193899.1 NTP transferase domain-containing protein [Govania unica]
MDSDVIFTANSWIDSGHRVALATVISTWGSAPRPVGSLLAVRDDGLMTGSVSGGCVENMVVHAATDVLAGGPDQLMEFGVSADDAWAVGLACGGTIKVHVGSGSAVPEIARRLKAKDSFAYCLHLDGGQSYFATPADPQIAPAIDRDTSRHVTTPGGSVFARVFGPEARLLIIGAVHIALPLVTIARAAGYEVTLIDPRTAFAHNDRFPGVTIVTEWPDDALEALGLDGGTAVVTLTHDPKIDDPALFVALQSKAFYVGALGSLKTQSQRRARLQTMGLDDHSLTRLHGPVGLAIGAATPAEIAIAIMAEITHVRRMGDKRPQMAAIVLAAGASSRMRDAGNKLTRLIDGKAVIRHTVEAALDSRAGQVLVVTGHDAAAIEQALDGLPVTLVHNPDHAQGMASSIRAGIRALPSDCDAAMILPGDMPFVRPLHLNAVLAAYSPSKNRSICRPIHNGQPGHPVLFGRDYFDALLSLDGDQGARVIVEQHRDVLVDVAVSDKAVLTDLDTPESFAALKGESKS